MFLVISQVAYLLDYRQLSGLDEFNQRVKVFSVQASVLVVVFHLCVLDVHKSADYSLTAAILLILEVDRAHDASVVDIGKTYNAEHEKNVDEFFHI